MECKINDVKVHGCWTSSARRSDTITCTRTCGIYLIGASSVEISIQKGRSFFPEPHVHKLLDSGFD